MLHRSLPKAVVRSWTSRCRKLEAYQETLQILSGLEEDDAAQLFTEGSHQELNLSMWEANVPDAGFDNTLIT